MSNIIESYIKQNEPSLSSESISIMHVVADYLTKEDLFGIKEQEIREVLKETDKFADMFMTPANDQKLQTLFINLVDNPKLKSDLLDITAKMALDEPYD